MSPPARSTRIASDSIFAPLIVAVIARIEPDHPKIPAQEQLLSAGCVAYNLLLGAQALGFGAQWLTGWAAYDREVAALLGLADERARDRLRAHRHRAATPRPNARVRRSKPMLRRSGIDDARPRIWSTAAFTSAARGSRRCRTSTTPTARPVNAVHGFTRFLLDLLERARPTHIAVAFDESLTTLVPQRDLSRLQGESRARAGRADAPVRRTARTIAAALGVTVLADATVRSRRSDRQRRASRCAAPASAA